MGDVTPLSLINKITLKVIEASESLCEVSGWRGELGVGGIHLTASPYLRYFRGLMVRTPDPHASDREFKPRWWNPDLY